MPVVKIKSNQQTLNGENLDIEIFNNLEDKRKLKEEILKKFNGEYFRSIIKPREINNNQKINDVDRSTENSNSAKGIEQRAKQYSQKEIISVFPSVLTMVYTQIYSEENEHIYDPFAGHNSRAEDVLNLKREYYAYDIHPKAVELTKKAIEKYDFTKYEINCGSSHLKTKYEDEAFDYGITSPPYWDAEKYNEYYNEYCGADLSNLKSYEQFKVFYEAVIKEIFRVLKKGKYFTIVIGNVIKNGEYYNLAMDTCQIAEKCGFKIHTIDIYNRGSNIGGDINYVGNIKTSKRLPIIHEYIITIKKL